LSLGQSPSFFSSENELLPLTAEGCILGHFSSVGVVVVNDRVVLVVLSRVNIKKLKNE